MISKFSIKKWEVRKKKKNTLLKYSHVFALRGVRTFLWNCVRI